MRAVSGRLSPEVYRAVLWGPDISQELQEATAAALRWPEKFSMVGSICRGVGGNKVFVIISRHEKYAED